MTFPHSATVQRKSKVGSQYTYSNYLTVQCFMQPLDSEKSQSAGIMYSKGYRCYFPKSSDVKEGDRLLIDGDIFGVKASSVYNYGNLQHVRAEVEKV